MRPQSETTGDRLESRGEEAEALGSPGLCWPGFEFSRERVAVLKVPAYCWSDSGEFWEFEDGEFLVTGPRDHGVRRRAAEEAAPASGWSHPSDCACPACRVTRL
jgi:hypothetical protein